MSKVNTFRCDWCDKLRVNDVNRWWTIQPAVAGIGLMPFNEQEGDHYCGEECAQAAIQRWMATGKLEPASATPLTPPEVQEALRRGNNL